MSGKRFSIKALFLYIKVIQSDLAPFQWTLKWIKINPGASYFSDLIRSEFFTSIFGDKQLADYQSVATVPTPALARGLRAADDFASAIRPTTI